ncbi:MAG TPA: tetratricopeptide repeat protein [Saprospiraceae bacterium]|nr:tetratricopeptide repeat protein [Saprospiraceae bacterium]
MKVITSLLIFFSCISIIRAQESGLITDREATYKRGKDLFSRHLFGPASVELQQYLNQQKQLIHPAPANLMLEADQMVKLSALYLNLPQGEKDLVDFVYRHSPDPVINEPCLALGSFYYNQKLYSKSITFYDKVKISDLKEDIRAESHFKKGYGYFVNRAFTEAADYFQEASLHQGAYYYPTHYYLGMCHYFDDNPKKAVTHFERVSKSPTYGPLVPYYIVQIYFSGKEYEKLIEYSERMITIPSTRNIKEIRLLLGQTYFLKGLYSQALPHLSYYEANTPRLTQEEFYQLAFTQYKLGMYQTAVNTFMEIALLDSKLGQLVNYYMADCYVQLGDLTSARSAFRKVAGMEFEKSMMEEATFNYGKLSAQLKHERDAINTLIKINKSSPFYTEARTIVNDILLHSADYTNSIEIMESLTDWSPEMEATYQKIAFQKAIQWVRDQNHANARIYFDKSDQHIKDQKLFHEGLFWRGYMLNKEGQYRNSNISLDRYLESSKTFGFTNVEASPMMAHYLQGYNNLKLGEYLRSAQSFRNTINSINQNRRQITQNVVLDRIYPDAALRAGDCLFRLNKYEDAYIFYEMVAASKIGNYDYARYQKALIMGLTNKPYDKIKILDQLIAENTDSDYMDDALFQLGETYLSLGNLVPASEAFSRLTRQFRGRSSLFIPSLLKLGLIAYNRGDSRQALQFYKEVFSHRPNAKETQEALIAIEEIYIRDLGDSEGYFSFVQSVPGVELTSLKKDSLNYQIARSRFDNGDYQRAMQLFSDYIKNNPNGAYILESYFFRGESRSILRQFKEALEDYNHLIVLGLNPYYYNSLRKAAIISYNYEQDFNRSYQYFSALSTAPVPSDQIYEANLGALRSAFRMGDPQGVIRFAPKVIASEGSTEAEINAAWYYLGKAFYNTSEYAQALEAFEHIKEFNSNQSAEAVYLMARIHMRQGNLSQAEEIIPWVTEKKANYPQWVARTIILYAEIYIAKNDLFNARAALEAVIDNFKDDDSIRKDAENILRIVESKEQEQNRIKVPERGFMEEDSIRNHRG